MLFSRRASQQPAQTPVQQDTEWLLTDTTHQVATLSRQDLKTLVRQQPSTPQVTSFSDNMQDLCSYTTHDSLANTISVPGFPRQYRLPALPTAFEQQTTSPPTNDTTTPRGTAAGPVFASFNPLLRALALTNPTHTLRPAQIVTDRSTLQQLLAFTTRAGPAQPWRLNLLRVHDTLFLIRSGKDAATLLLSDDGSGDDDEKQAYRRGFTARFTAPLAGHEAGATAAIGRHYRVVSYTFGGLEMVVRFEVDAVLRDDDEVQQQQQQESEEGTVSVVDTVAASLASEAAERDDGTAGPEITAIALGPDEEVLREEVADLWLRAHERSFFERMTSRWDVLRFARWREPATPKWREVLPRAWFGRAAWVMQGMHLAGTITKAPVQGRPSVHWADWEDKYQAELKRMLKLLEWMRDTVGGVDGKEDGTMQRAVLVCEVLEGQGVMKMYGVKDRAAIETLDEKDVARLWATEDQPGTGAANVLNFEDAPSLGRAG